jgi:large subunit ribosomal protein L21
MEAYAVVETGGKQYRVQKGDVLDIELLDAEVGKNIDLSKVLAVSDGKDLKVGAPDVAGASVIAKVVAQLRAPKVISFKKKRRKGFRKTIGHRQGLLKIEVEKITA